MGKLEKIKRREFLTRTGALLPLFLLPWADYQKLSAETDNKVRQISLKKQLEEIISLDKIHKKENDILLKVYKVEFLPTTIFYHKNKEIFNKIGCMNKKDLTG